MKIPHPSLFSSLILAVPLLAMLRAAGYVRFGASVRLSHHRLLTGSRDRDAAVLYLLGVEPFLTVWQEAGFFKAQHGLRIPVLPSGKVQLSSRPPGIRFQEAKALPTIKPRSIALRKCSSDSRHPEPSTAMKLLAFLLFAAVWTPAWAEEATEKEPASTPAEASTPDVHYEMTGDETRLVRFLLELKQNDLGKTHKNDLLNYGSSDKPSSPVLVGFRNDKAKKQHIYLFRFGQRHIAYAWVGKGGTPIPIPDVPDGTPEENASHYGLGESVTDADVLDGEGIYILRGATLKWLEGLKD